MVPMTGVFRPGQVTEGMEAVFETTNLAISLEVFRVFVTIIDISPFL